MSTNQSQEFGSLYSADTGTVRCWDKAQGRWIDRFAVDVREGLATGSLSLAGPNVRMVGSSGEVVVTESQIEEMSTRGYKIVEDDTQAETDAPSQESDVKKSTPVRSNYDFAQHVLSDLREMGNEADIKHFDSMRKSELVEALAASGFTP